MKKLIKILGIVFAAFLLSIIIGLLVLRKMFPPEKVKAIIVREVSEKLKREVKLGEVKIGLFSGVSISDFVLSESPDFKNGTFIQSEKFYLKFQLRPLLQKKIVIDAVGLEAPQVRVIQYPDGKTFNFSDLLSKPTAQKAESKKVETGPTSPLNFFVSKAKISKGKVEFIDQSPKKIKVLLNPIDCTVVGAGLEQPLLLELSVGIESFIQGKDLKGSLKTKVIAELQNQKVKFESFQWKMDGLTLDLKGRITDFAKLEMDLSALVGEVNVQKLSRFLTLPKEIRILGSPQLGLELKGHLENLALSFSLDLLKTNIAYSDLFQKNEGTNFSVTMNGKVKKKKDLTVDSLQIKIAGIETNLKGELQELTSPNPNIKVQVRTNSFDLKEIANLVKLANSYQPAGQISLEANSSGNLKLPRLEGSLNLEKVQAKVEKFNLESISGKIKFTESSLDISNLTGKFGVPNKTSSEFKIRSSIKNFQTPDIFLDAHLSSLDLAMFMGDKKKEEKKKESAKAEDKKEKEPYKGPEIKMEGQVVVGKILYTKFEGQNAKISWKLARVTPPLDQINGVAELKMENGKIHKIPLLMTIAPIVKIDPSGIAYSQMGGHFNLMQGTAQTNDFQVNSPTIDLFAKGTIHLPTNKPDLLLTAKLPKGSVGGGVEEMTADEMGRPTFVFKIKNDWKPVLDSSQVQKKVVEKATQEIKKKANEFLQGEGKKMLEGIFKR